MVKKRRFDNKGLNYAGLGKCIDAFRRKERIGIRVVCQEACMSPNTYYKMLKGREYKLQYYLRILFVFAINSSNMDDLLVFLFNFAQTSITETYCELGEEWGAEIEKVFERAKSRVSVSSPTTKI